MSNNYRKEHYKRLLIQAASDHLEFTMQASEAAFAGDENAAQKFQAAANNTMNTMLTLQRRIFSLEAVENNRKLRLVH